MKNKKNPLIYLIGGSFLFCVLFLISLYLDISLDLYIYFIWVGVLVCFFIFLVLWKVILSFRDELKRLNLKSMNLEDKIKITITIFLSVFNLSLIMFILPYFDEALCQPKPLPSTSSGFDLPSGSGATSGEKLMELDTLQIDDDLEKLTSENATKQQELTDDHSLSSKNLVQSHDLNLIQVMTLKRKIETLGSKLIIRDLEHVESSSTLISSNDPLVDPSQEDIKNHLTFFKERCKLMESVETDSNPVALDVYSPKRLAIHYNKLKLDEEGISLTHLITTLDQLVKEPHEDIVIIPSTIQESYNLGLANVENSSKDLATLWEKYKETSMDLNDDERVELDLAKSIASKQQLKGLDYSSNLLRVAIRDNNNDAFLKAHELFTITESESKNTEKLLNLICEKLKD